MTITIQAVADDPRHGASILAHLANAGFARSRVHVTPTGMDRLLRATSFLYSNAINHATAIATVMMASLGGSVAIGVGLGIVADPTGSAMSAVQMPLIIAGLLPIGTALGALLGMIAGVLIGSLRMSIQRHSQAIGKGPMLLVLDAETIDSAMAAETIMHDSGAHEIRIRQFDA